MASVFAAAEAVMLLPLRGDVLRYFVIVLCAWNVAVCIVYGIDKKRSLSGAWRIPERTLLLLAFLLGGVGAYAGMRIFHHKTLHKKFTIGVPLCILWNLLVLTVLLKPELMLGLGS